MEGKTASDFLQTSATQGNYGKFPVYVGTGSEV